MAGFESHKGGNLPPPRGSPEGGPKVRVHELKNVKMGSGSLADCLEAGKREGRYQNITDWLVLLVNYFGVPETREVVDLQLINFSKGMTFAEVERWLAESPEYVNYQLARVEHLDALNSDPRFAEMIQEEGDTRHNSYGFRCACGD